MSYDRSNDCVVDFHLLGKVCYDQCLRLQRRVVYERQAGGGRRIVVLLCEHPQLISIGRHGSRSHIRRTDAELRRLQLGIRWTNRSGGCILHSPGQLAVYPIVPLDRLGWSLGEFREKLGSALQSLLVGVGISSQPSSEGLTGRSGLLAALGVSLDEQVSFDGAFLNVHPPMANFRFVDTARGEAASGTCMSSLLAERRLPVRMSQMRSALIPCLLEAFEADRHHIHSGHLWLHPRGPQSESIAHAG